MTRSRPPPETWAGDTPDGIVSALVLDILPWLAAFFVLDALVHLRRGQVVFAREGWGSPRPLRGGLRIAGLTPFGLSVVGYELPIIVTSEGLWWEDPENGSPPVVREEVLEFLPFETLGEVEAVRSSVRAQGRVLCRMRAVGDAQHLAQLLNRLRAEPQEARGRILDAWEDAAFDVAAARSRWARMRRPWMWTALTGTLETLLLFVGLPWLATRGEVDLPIWAGAFGALLLLHLLAVVFAGWTLRRARNPDTSLGNTLFTMAVFPAYAARAGVQVVRDAFSSYEPLVLAGVFLPRETLLAEARREWSRITESGQRARAPGLKALFEARRQRIEIVLSALGLSSADMLSPPPEVPAGAAWCPVCGCAHREGFSHCADCEVPLVASVPPSSATPAPVSLAG